MKTFKEHFNVAAGQCGADLTVKHTINWFNLKRHIKIWQINIRCTIFPSEKLT